MAEPRPGKVAFSAKITGDQGYWLDSHARRLGKSAGEALRIVLDWAMANEATVFPGTLQARKPSNR